MSSALAERTHDGLRRAALTLHALAPAERQWMLDRLPAARRSEVEALLAELATLGIPRDRSLVSAALGGRPHPTPEALAAERERAPDTGALITLLRQEPPTLIAIALQAQDPHVRDEVLRGLPARASQEVRRTLDCAMAVPPALRAALLEEMAPEISAAVERPMSSPAPFMRRWQAGWWRMTGGLA